MKRNFIYNNKKLQIESKIADEIADEFNGRGIIPPPLFSALRHFYNSKLICLDLHLCH